jgi:hypothetical protein
MSNQELSEVFYTFLITSIIGCILATGKILYKSKCKDVSFCCIKFTRDTEIEYKEDIELGTKDEEMKK